MPDGNSGIRENRAHRVLFVDHRDEPFKEIGETLEGSYRDHKTVSVKYSRHVSETWFEEYDLVIAHVAVETRTSMTGRRGAKGRCHTAVFLSTGPLSDAHEAAARPFLFVRDARRHRLDEVTRKDLWTTLISELLKDGVPSALADGTYSGNDSLRRLFHDPGEVPEVLVALSLLCQAYMFLHRDEAMSTSADEDSEGRFLSALGRAGFQKHETFGIEVEPSLTDDPGWWARALDLDGEGRDRLYKSVRAVENQELSAACAELFEALDAKRTIETELVVTLFELLSDVGRAT